MRERPLALTRNRLAVLRTMLTHEEPVTATQIAEGTGIIHATVNTSLTYLEDQGLVIADRPERRQGVMRRFTLPNRRLAELLLESANS